MRNVWILLSLIGVLAAGFWVKNLRRENNRLESRVQQVERSAQTTSAVAATNTRLQAQLQNERSRLDRLQAALAEVIALTDQPPTGSVDAHVVDLGQRIRSLENQILALRSQNLEVRNGAFDYRQQTKSAVVDQRANLQQQIVRANQRLVELENELTGLNRIPRSNDSSLAIQDVNAEIAQVRAQREALRSQVESIATVKESSELAAAQGERNDLNEINSEKSILEAQVVDLREELNFWQQQRANSTVTNRAARIKQLQDQIRAQESRLSDLSRQ